MATEKLDFLTMSDAARQAWLAANMWVECPKCLGKGGTYFYFGRGEQSDFDSAKCSCDFGKQWLLQEKCSACEPWRATAPDAVCSFCGKSGYVFAGGYNRLRAACEAKGWVLKILGPSQQPDLGDWVQVIDANTGRVLAGVEQDEHQTGEAAIELAMCRALAPLMEQEAGE